MDAFRVGDEFQVNTATAGNQKGAIVTSLGEGRFVVIWVDNSQGVGGAEGDTSGSAIKGQVYDETYQPVGGEFLVNTETAGSQLNPVVTAMEVGGLTQFVVAWEDRSGAGGDTSGSAIRAQRFALDGSKSGPELQVNTTTAGQQTAPQIAAVGSGFVITWADASRASPDDSAAIRAQLYNGALDRVGDEILVNTTTQGGQYAPYPVGLEGGGFVIGWTDQSGTGADPEGIGQRFQIFTSTATKSGEEIVSNTATLGNQNDGKITALQGGGFVVTWTDYGGGVGGAEGDTDAAAVKAQVFNSTGGRVGGEILVNTTTSHSEYAPQIAPLGDGFVVVWSDVTFGEFEEWAQVRAQVFDGNGQKIGGQIEVSDDSGANLPEPRVIAFDGGFLITWQDDAPPAGDEDGSSIKARAFFEDGTPATGEILVNSTVAGSQGHPSLAITDVGFVVVWEDATGDAAGSAVKGQVFTFQSNEPPEVGGLTGSVTWYEGDDAVRVANGATLSDPDSTQLSKVEVRIGTGFEAAQDQLQFEPTGATGDIEGDYNVTTGVMTLTSSTATLAQFQAALRAVTYRNTSLDPVGETRTIEIVATDDEGAASDAATRTLGITGQNDAPAGADKTITMGEDTSRTLTAADFGFTDVDGDILASV
ncbi:MAG: hypothetical protein ABW360_06355, partial [Phenylobacterium sp.]